MDCMLCGVTTSHVLRWGIGMLFREQRDMAINGGGRAGARWRFPCQDDRQPVPERPRKKNSCWWHRASGGFPSGPRGVAGWLSRGVEGRQARECSDTLCQEPSGPIFTCICGAQSLLFDVDEVALERPAGFVSRRSNHSPPPPAIEICPRRQKKRWDFGPGRDGRFGSPVLVQLFPSSFGAWGEDEADMAVAVVSPPSYVFYARTLGIECSCCPYRDILALPSDTFTSFAMCLGPAKWRSACPVSFASRPNHPPPSEFHEDQVYKSSAVQREAASGSFVSLVRLSPRCGSDHVCAWAPRVRTERKYVIFCVAFGIFPLLSGISSTRPWPRIQRTLYDVGFRRSHANTAV